MSRTSEWAHEMVLTLTRLSHTAARGFTAGDRVGDQTHRVVTVLAHGAIGIFLHRPGHARIALEILGRGMFLQPVGDSDHAARAWIESVALADGLLLQLPRRAFDQAMTQDPQLANLVLVAHEQQRHGLHLHRALLDLPPLPRIAATLLFLGERLGEGTSPASDLPVTQDLVAAAAGLSRQTTNQALRHLDRSGVIRARRRSIQLERPPALHDVAEGRLAGLTRPDRGTRLTRPDR